MDHQKTGALIAKRRTALGLTQRELAETLKLSDRTVSKWERGAGFPDISLVEPLADALGLSVLELLHGEEAPAAPPDCDRSARETLRALLPEVGVKLKRGRHWLTALAVLLAIAAAALVWLIANPIRGYSISSETITAAQAADISPFVLITTEEYRLLEEMLSDPEISSQFADGTVLKLDDAITTRYQNRVCIEGQTADTVHLSVIEHSLWLDYMLGNKRCILTAARPGEISKTAAEYKTVKDDLLGEPVYVLSNRNNTDFSLYSSKRDLLAPFQSSDPAPAPTAPPSPG